MGKNDEMVEIIYKWEGWDKDTWPVRKFLMSWLCDRDDGQIVEDAVVMTDKVELLTSMKGLMVEAKEYI